MEIQVENKVDIEQVTDVELTASNVAEVSVADDTALDVSVVKKEYKIVGDEVYIAKLYEDAPQWMKDLVQLVVDNTMASESTALLNSLVSQLNQFAVSYVPLNTYTQSILDLSNADTAMHNTIETLNSNFNDGLNEANSQIIDLQSTKASKTEVATKVIETITAQLALPTSDIGATIANLQQAIVNGDSANADSITTLTSSLEGEVDARATATEYLNTYVGINSSGTATGTGILADLEILQKQADGVINTYSNTYDVMLGIEDPNNNTDNDQLVTTVEPYASWLAEDTLNGNENVRLAHIGDVYIKYSNTTAGAKEYIASYKFIKTVVDSTSPYATDADGFTWALIIDQAAQDAYQQALKARDLADGKRRVFVGLGAASTPKVPYDQGDLWLIDAARVVNGYNCKVGDILRCTETKGEIGIYEQNDWVLASSYANAVDAQNQQFQDFVDNDYTVFATSIQGQVDKKAETFYQNSVPTGRIKATNVPDSVTLNAYVGDLWKNIYEGTISGYLGNNTEYIYTKTANGSNWNYDWVKMEVPDIIFDTIDTKKSIYGGNTVPVAVSPDVIEVNDMWITGDSPTSPYLPKSIYVWDGVSWVVPVRYTDDTQVIALQTGLANGTVELNLASATIDGSISLSSYVTAEIDGKVGIYSGETAPVNGQPSGAAINDIYLWFTTASKVLANGTTQVYDITRTYKYSGSVWNEITTDSNITALADLADGKRTVFSGATIPGGAVERDIWIPSADVNITTSGMCTVAGGTWNGTVCSITKYSKGEVYQYLTSKWSLATKYSADIASVSSNLQTQLDGKVDTYYQATVPTGMLATNNGDYWYCTADVSTYKKGKVYKYVHATTSWAETADVSRYAFDTADGKASIFTSTTLPNVYKINDLMIVVGSNFSNGTTTFTPGVTLTSTANRTGSFVAADWIKKINDTEDLNAFVNVTYTPMIVNLQGQIDNKVESWYTLSTSDPKSAWTTAALKLQHNGDMWYQTDTKNSYYYTSSTDSWNALQDATALQALANAATAQATADGVVESYYAQYQDTAPTTSSMWLNKTGTKVLKEYVGGAWNNVSVKVGDTLTAYDATTKDISVFVYYNGTWVSNTAGGLVANSNAVTNLSTELNNGTNTWAAADSSVVNSLTTTINNGDAAVQAKWAYNSTVAINGVYKKSGFGLTSNYSSGSGTVNDPYLSEFWIDATKLKFTNSATTGSTAPFTIDASGATPQITFNGKVSFSNVSGAPGGSGNLLYNSAPALGNEQKGWQIGWYNTSIAPVLGAGFDPWRPSGGGSVFATIPGAPTIGGVFDVLQTNTVPVVGGSWYDASAYTSSHRCTSYVNIAWFDSNGTYINEVGGSQVATAGGGALVGWGRSVLFAQAPANAAKASFFVRSIVNGTDPYCFVAFAYLGKSVVGQTVHSDWSEGTSAGATRTSELTNDAEFTTLSAVASQGYVLPAGVAHAINTNTTTIDGAKITTGSIAADKINVNDVFSRNITYTGVITGGNVAGGGIIKSYNGRMVIDLVNGSIYIA